MNTSFTVSVRQTFVPLQFAICLLHKELGNVPNAISASAGRLGRKGPPTAEEFQLHLCLECTCIPELLFQPSICGIDQAGVAEIIAGVLKQLPPRSAERCAEGGVLLTGGNTAFPGKHQSQIKQFSCSYKTVFGVSKYCTCSTLGSTLGSTSSWGRILQGKR